MSDARSRDVLPIPDRPHVGLTTYDAKDPATAFPPIEPLRPPAGAPNVLVVLIDDAGFGSSSAFGGPCRTPTFEKPRGEGAQVQPLPHDRAVLADAAGAPHRPQPPRGRDGRDHRDRDLGARLQLRPAEHRGAARRDAEAERLLDGAVRQVPRGAGLGDEPPRPVRLLADRRRRLRALLRLHRRRDEPVRPGDLPRHRARRAGADAGRGLPLHGGHDGQGDRLDPSAEGAHGRQAVLRLLRPRCDARPAPRAAGVVGPVQGRVRPGVGRAARADAGPPEGARRGPGGRGADRATRGDPRLGRHAGRSEAGARAPDGGLRGLHGAHRPPRRAADRRARGAGDPRRHARLRDRRRQRRLRGRDAERLLQRAHRPQRRGRPRDRGVHDLADRRLRHAAGLQPLRRRLGARDGHALPVDEAGRLALGRDAERHDRPLARRHRREGRGPLAVPPRDRRGGHRPRRGRVARADVRPRRPADAAPRRLDATVLRRRRGAGSARDAVLRDVLQPRHLPPGLDRVHPPQHPVGDGGAAAARPGRLGALRARRLDAGAQRRGGEPREAGAAPDAVPDRGGEVQRAPAGRPSRRALQPRPRRPAAARPRHAPDPVRRDGAVDRELGRGDEEQVVRADGRGGGSRTTARTA